VGDELTRAVDRLVGQVAHWEAGRWSAGTPPAPGLSRADRVHALAQRLADRGADAEGRARRPVPRLADQVLPDQLRVLAADLIAAAPPPPVLTEATADVRQTHHSL
jgi:hypothetical protein